MDALLTILIAPVLIWIYGGGYTGGSKVSSGNPAGLIAQSQKDGSPGIIFVAMNYRLGLFVRSLSLSYPSITN